MASFLVPYLLTPPSPPSRVFLFSFTTVLMLLGFLLGLLSLLACILAIANTLIGLFLCPLLWLAICVILHSAHLTQAGPVSLLFPLLCPCVRLFLMFFTVTGVSIDLLARFVSTFLGWAVG